MCRLPKISQVWDPKGYVREAGFVSALGLPVIDLLAPQFGEKVLDLGCGDGTLALKLMEMGCDVTGVDSSSEFVAVAREKGVDARHVDGNTLSFTGEFDAVFSNAALHWMTKPEVVIAGVYRALKPAGRFVGEFGGHGNVDLIVEALNQTLRAYGIAPEPLHPWFFPTAKEYTNLLEKRGFKIKEMSLFPRPTLLPDDITGWLNTFAQNFLTAVPESGRALFLEKVRDKLSHSIRGANGEWIADYVRLRFYAVR